MTAAERNLIQYIEDNYSGWDASEAIADALENDRDLFLSHVQELFMAHDEKSWKEARNGRN